MSFVRNTADSSSRDASQRQSLEVKGSQIFSKRVYQPSLAMLVFVLFVNCDTALVNLQLPLHCVVIGNEV